MGGKGSGARRRPSACGAVGPAAFTLAPARVQGVVQRGGEVIPTDCPHCHAEAPMWVRDVWQGWCRTCGAVFFKTRYQIPPPESRRSGNPHPVPLA